MPNPHYRRALRAKHTSQTQAFFNVYVLPEVVVKQSGTSELEKIRSYFLKVLDMMIQYDNFKDTTEYLQSILQTIETQVEYYRILELIEDNLLSVALNISNSVNPKLIDTRIKYIQSIIQTMPPICQERGPISELILELIESILEGVRLESIRGTIESIQTYLTKHYGNQSHIELIQTNLLNIIESIKNGTNQKLVTLRINYVTELINSIPV